MLVLQRIIMAANAAGIYGSQIFRSDDAPKFVHTPCSLRLLLIDCELSYHRGFDINVGLISLALAFAIFQIVQYRVTAKGVEREVVLASPARSDTSGRIEEDEK